VRAVRPPELKPETRATLFTAARPFIVVRFLSCCMRGRAERSCGDETVVKITASCAGIFSLGTAGYTFPAIDRPGAETLI
jgi:hypothetical protein